MNKTVRAHTLSDDPRPTEEISGLHGPIEPLEVYKSDPIEAELEYHIDDKVMKMTLPVWRISPLGIELALPKDVELPGRVGQGHKVNLRVKLRDQLCEFQGLLLNSTHSQNNRRLIGIRWFGDRDKEDPQGGSERRRNDRWVCEKDFMPVGVAPNPTRFADFLHFKVIDISASGMQLATSLRNRMVIPGMTLESSVIFPMCSQLKIKFKIVHTRVGDYEGRQVLFLGVTLHKPDRKLLANIGQYVFQFGPPTSIENLKKQGLIIENVSHGIEFGYVRTEREYLEVLQLRKAVYVATVDNLSADQPDEKFADLYDSRARILTARRRGKLIATVRLLFPEPGDRFETEEHTELPEGFPEHYAAVEMSRLTIHPEFMETDLFYGITRRAFLTAVQSKRRWMCTYAPEQLLPYFKKLGARTLGSKFTPRMLGSKEQEILVWDMPRVLAGYGINPFVWNQIVSDLTEYVRDQDAVEFGLRMRIRSWLYRALRPLAPIFLRNRSI